MNAARQVVTFDPERHVYSAYGSIVPSVTQIIARAGLSDFSHVDPAVLAAAKDRGTRVHRACELDDLGTLDEATVDQDERGYLEAWRKFRSTVVARIEATERMVYNKTYGYAGTLDVLLTTLEGQQWIVDRKTGVPDRAAGLQLAGYLLALGGQEFKRGRYAVHLSSDATYKVIAYRDAYDFAAFTAALTVANWKNRR